MASPTPQAEGGFYSSRRLEATRESFGVRGQPQFPLQPFLNGSRGSAGPRRVVDDCSVLWAFCRVATALSLVQELKVHYVHGNHQPQPMTPWAPTVPNSGNTARALSTNTRSTSPASAPTEPLSAAEPCGQPAGGNRPRGYLYLWLSFPKPNTSGSWSQFTGRPPPQASRSNTGSN